MNQYIVKRTDGQYKRGMGGWSPNQKHAFRFTDGVRGTPDLSGKQWAKDNAAYWTESDPSNPARAIKLVKKH